MLFRKISELRNSKGFIKVFFNTGWLMVDKISRLIIGLFISVWVTRYLGAEQFGIYSYAISFAAVFTSIASLGLDSVLIRELVKDEKRRDVLLGTAFWLKMGGSFLSIILLILVLGLTSQESNINIFIFLIVAGTIFQSFNVIDFYFQSKLLSKSIVIANITTIVISTIIKILLILSKASLISFVAVLFFDSVLMGLGYLFYYHKNNFSVKKWKIDLDLCKYLLKESWPLILSGIAISLALRVDQIMLKEYVDPDKLGIYSVGVRLAEVFTFLPIIISQSLFPKFVLINFSTEKKKLYRIIRYVFYGLCGVSFFVYLSAEYAVDLLYGKEFIFGHKVLQILVWTVPVTYLGIVTNKILLIQNNQKIVFIKQLFLTVLNISLNLYLIPIYGIIGAAWATLIADVLVNLFMDLFFSKARWIYYLKMKALFFSF